MAEEPADDISILAPVPSIILREAVREAKPLVAFGSDLDALWGTLSPGRYRVYIYESHLNREDGELGATFEGVVERWARYEDTREADRACRPGIAEATDTPWAYWWFVSGLRARPLLPFREMTRKDKTDHIPPGHIPHGPELLDETKTVA